MLTATSLCHAFGTPPLQTPVLRDVSFQVRPSEFTLITGPSGSGKSTLLAILSGLLVPVHGSVRALGADLGGMTDPERDRFRLRNTGFIFQNFNLFPALTALEQVCMPLSYLEMRKHDVVQRAYDALSAVGLRQRAHARPVELSGGEQQRVAIARAIAKSPRLLFADEPTSALDSRNGHDVVKLLQGIARDSQAIVLCVSHDPRVISCADRVIRMQDGVIQSDVDSRTSAKGVLPLRVVS